MSKERAGVIHAIWRLRIISSSSSFIKDDNPIGAQI